MIQNFIVRLFLILITISTFIACTLLEKTKSLIDDDVVDQFGLTDNNVSMYPLNDYSKKAIDSIEKFTNLDVPDTVTLQAFKYTTPWGYNKEENATRLYPIVVNGCWGEGHLFSVDVCKKYPSFYLDFNEHSSESDGILLANLLDAAIKAGFRIDMNRIYLTGFSAGGSGSFKIVRGMLTKGKLFAGIIRVAGQSETVLAENAIGKTSIWYHIGLNDDTERIKTAGTTFNNLRNHPFFDTAVLSIKRDTVTTGYPRETLTYTKDGIEFIKYSEYEGMGHDPDACYKDLNLFDWLFNQTLENRLSMALDLHHIYID